MNAAKILLAAGLIAGIGLTAPAHAADPVKVALIADSTGPLEAYAKQTITGFKLGLEYYTKGTMEVAGRKITVLEKDSQNKPDVGRNVLSEAFETAALNVSEKQMSSALYGSASVAEILAELNIPLDRRRALQQDVGRCLRANGWKIFQPRRDGKQLRRYRNYDRFPLLVR